MSQHPVEAATQRLAQYARHGQITRDPEGSEFEPRPVGEETARAVGDLAVDNTGHDIQVTSYIAKRIGSTVRRVSAFTPFGATHDQAIAAQAERGHLVASRNPLAKTATSPASE